MSQNFKTNPRRRTSSAAHRRLARVLQSRFGVKSGEISIDTPEENLLDMMYDKSPKIEEIPHSKGSLYMETHIRNAAFPPLQNFLREKAGGKVTLEAAKILATMHVRLFSSTQADFKLHPEMCRRYDDLPKTVQYRSKAYGLLQQRGKTIILVGFFYVQEQEDSFYISYMDSVKQIAPKEFSGWVIQNCIAAFMRYHSDLYPHKQLVVYPCPPPGNLSQQQYIFRDGPLLEKNLSQDRLNKFWFDTVERSGTSNVTTLEDVLGNIIKSKGDATQLPFHDGDVIPNLIKQAIMQSTKPIREHELLSRLSTLAKAYSCIIVTSLPRDSDHQLSHVSEVDLSSGFDDDDLELERTRSVFDDRASLKKFQEEHDLSFKTAQSARIATAIILSELSKVLPPVHTPEANIDCRDVVSKPSRIEQDEQATFSESLIQQSTTGSGWESQIVLPRNGNQYRPPTNTYSFVRGYRQYKPSGPAIAMSRDCNAEFHCDTSSVSQEIDDEEHKLAWGTVPHEINVKTFQEQPAADPSQLSYISLDPDVGGTTGHDQDSVPAFHTDSTHPYISDNHQFQDSEEYRLAPVHLALLKIELETENLQEHLRGFYTELSRNKFRCSSKTLRLEKISLKLCRDIGTLPQLDVEEHALASVDFMIGSLQDRLHNTQALQLQLNSFCSEETIRVEKILKEFSNDLETLRQSGTQIAANPKPCINLQSHDGASTIDHHESLSVLANVPAALHRISISPNTVDGHLLQLIDGDHTLALEDLLLMIESLKGQIPDICDEVRQLDSLCSTETLQYEKIIIGLRTDADMLQEKVTKMFSNTKAIPARSTRAIGVV